MYNYLVAGFGIYGAIFAYETSKRGNLSTLRQLNIAGNVYIEKVVSKNVHKYGIHIFYQNNEKVRKYINQFAKSHFTFGSRLGQYKYYDMDQVTTAVLDCCDRELI